MDKRESLEEMAKFISQYGFATELIESKNLNKPLLVAVRKGERGKIMIFDGEHGQNEIAFAAYSINNNGVFLSQFVVKEGFQQKGIGRFMWDLVMAHGDALSKTYIYGEANPTDPIEGVSDQDDSSFKKERGKIKEIYRKLGCTFDGEMFIRKWKEGERLKKSKEEIVNLINKVIEDEPETK